MTGFGLATTLVAVGLILYGLWKIEDDTLRHAIAAVVIGLIIYINGRVADARREVRQWQSRNGG